MPQLLNLQRLIPLSAALGIMMIASATVWADPITIIGNTTFSDIKQWRLGGFSTPQQTEVSEPASLLLLGSGLVGTAGALRRRHKNRSNHNDCSN